MQFAFVVSAALGYHIPHLFENESSFAEFRDALRFLKRQGFSGVELNLPFAERATLQKIRETVHQAGLPLAAVGTGLVYVEKGLSITDPDSVKRERAIDTVKQLTEFAANEGAILIIGMVRGGSSVNGKRMEVLRESLVECDGYASQHNVRIALEAVNRYETCLLNTAADVSALIQAEKLSSTGLLLDTFHMNIEERSPEATIREHHANIAHFHIADSNRWPPGQGHLHLEEQLRLLDELGYHGWVSGEVISKPDNPTAVAETADFLRTHEFFRN